jgi:hypothetical protein
MHDADKDCARRDRFAKVAESNPAGAVNGQVDDLRAQAFEKPTWFDDRRMLDPSGDDVITLITKRKGFARNEARELRADAARSAETSVVSA